MKSIGIFVKNLTSGGAEKQAVLLARVLAGYAHIHFIVFNGDKVHEKYLVHLKEDYRIAVVMFKGRHISRFIQLIKYLKANKISIIFSYLTAANFYACMAGKLSRTKVYTGLRNIDLPLKKKLADKLLTNYFAAGTIVNCYVGKKNFIRHGFSKNKLTVIPNGFENIQAYREKLPSNKIRIITVGRFHPQKDYETAIKSFAKLHKACENTEYYIVGYGDEEQNIRNLVKELGLEAVCKIFINPNNISELLNSSDIYLSTSLIEGTSNSIMEAMNAALPIVATNVGDNIYLIENGVNGFLLPTKDICGLTEKLTKLSGDTQLRKRMGKESLNRLWKNYSVETFRNNYLKIAGIIL